MGFIKAFAGAVSGALNGAFADQWKDFLTPPAALPPTAGVFPAVPVRQNAGRGTSARASENIITNGSRIVVPEATALVTFQDGQLTGLIAEPGGYIYTSQDPNSQSVFAGGEVLSSTVGMSWERFKFGGQPGSQQLAFYVNLKEIPNNRFGTQSEIYWDDAYIGTQAGALTRGTYSLRIVDPVLFVKQFVPLSFLSAGSPVFDFADMNNDAATQLFNEVVASLAAAFSRYTNDPGRGNRITRIQGDAIGFAQSLAAAVEDGYQWTSGRGVAISKAAIAAIEYDAKTRELLSDVQKADALRGERGNSFMQQAAARGFQAAGEGDGGAGNMAMLGWGMNAAGQAAAGFQQPPSQAPAPQQPPAPQSQQPSPQQPSPQQAPAQEGTSTPEPAPQAGADDPVARLTQLKTMLDQELITQADYDAAKAKILGL